MSIMSLPKFPFLTTLQLCLFCFFPIFCAKVCCAQWEQANGPPGANVSSLVINGKGILAGTGQGIFNSTDDGQTWNKLKGGVESAYIISLAVTEMEIFSVFCFAQVNSEVFVGTAKGVFRSINHGDSWTLFSKGSEISHVNSMLAMGDVFYAGTGQGLFVSSDGGENWALVKTGLPNRLYVTTFAEYAGSIFLGTFDGVFRSDDNGAS